VTITTGPVSLGEPEATVLAQYDPAQRWNGFIAAPFIDALSAVQVLDWIGADHEYGVTYGFTDSGVLVVHDVQYSDPESSDYDPQYSGEVYPPDADGLYALGAFAWVWTEA